jgi:hypothetical protein
LKPISGKRHGSGILTTVLIESHPDWKIPVHSVPSEFQNLTTKPSLQGVGCPR